MPKYKLIYSKHFDEIVKNGLNLITTLKSQIYFYMNVQYLYGTSLIENVVSINNLI